jgi:transposase
MSEFSGSRPSLWTKRQLIDGMRWLVRVGAPWRDVPVEYGSWSALEALFRRWQRDGTWRQIVTALQCLVRPGEAMAGAPLMVAR